MYKPEKVDDQVVKDALGASLWAPNHRMTYPWRYIDVRGGAREQLADLSVELKRAVEEISDVKAKALRNNVLQPSHWIALALRRNANPAIEHEDYATLACSVQIASMYLWERGLGSKWSTGAASMHPRAYEILDLSPEEFKLEGALMIGVPMVMPKAPARPELDQFYTVT